MIHSSNPFTVTVVAAPIVPPVGGLPTWASDANLPAGNVKQISLNTIGDCWEGPPPAGSGTIGKAVDAWTSGVDAPLLGANGSKVWSGGGDADSWDTAVFAFDYATQLWSRIKDRTTAMTWNPAADKATPVGDPKHFDRTYCEHGDGTPGAPHTYDLMDYIGPEACGDPKGAFVWPSSNFVYTIDVTLWAHKFTLNGKQWSRAGTAQTPLNYNMLGTCAYEAGTKRLWCLSSTGTGSFADSLTYLDFSSGTGVGVPGTVSLGGSRLVYSGVMRFWSGVDGTKRYLLISFSGGIQLIDLNNPQLGVHVVALSAVIPNFGYPGSGFCEARSLGCFFSLPPYASIVPNTVFKVTPPTGDPVTGTWTVQSVTMTGTIPSWDGANMICKRLHYVDSLHCLTWFYSASGSVYAYRPVGA